MVQVHHVAQDRKQRGLGKPETFNFLGFTFICSKSRRGKFQIKRKFGVTACGRSYSSSAGAATADASADSPARA